jgi:hypothetical protein
VTPKRFVASLADIHLPAVFNPYADCCDVHDRKNAARLRKKNLELFLGAALEEKVDTIWIARDLGYRGGRRTGVPLTDEVHLNVVAKMLGGIALARATHGPAIAERTAAVVWKVIGRIGEPVVLWNIFPFHPHEPGDSFTNRCHTAAEREQTMPLLKCLIDMFKPRRLVAIGRDAQLALENIAMPLIGVRHPSYGGQGEFMQSLYRMYGVEREESQESELGLIPA